MMHLKLAVSFFFITAGLVALLTMLYVMGRPEKKLSPGAMRNTHRSMGLIFTILLIVLAYIGGRFVGATGDGMPLRAVFHAVLALSLVAVLFMKILIVKFYRELMRFVPTMGLIVFALALVVFFTSSGFHLVRGLASAPAAMSEKAENPEPDLEPDADAGSGTDTESATGSGSDQAAAVVAGGEVAASARPAAENKPDGDAKAGRDIFNNKCVGCHNTDSRKALFGPGLLGLMKWETLASTGGPPTFESVRDQIINPAGTMPAFTTFSKKEMNNLLAYLGTL